MTEQEVKEKIDELIWSVLSFGGECSVEWWVTQKSTGRPFLDHRRKYLFSLLKQAGYVQLAEDQSLPEVPLLDTGKEQEAYMLGQQDMLKANFRKVEL